ncbi:hypothetical protein [Paenirhodobacter populi]|uniref:Chromosomal replication initiator protein DnaA n=1 Tax=Paenirhodobacter populi TaxID=2306993 RepID=A0A443J7A5_9RHOB|nr:hypothetical protein [Sinirhodobacter populi]RWR16414.1 hypothetical protein D2T30_21725 [Sinirhodobacter populi]
MNRKQREYLRDVFRAAAGRHGLTEADLYIRDQSKPLVAARHEAWAEARRSGFTLKEIASIAGWDHTSVMHGARRPVQ